MILSKQNQIISAIREGIHILKERVNLFLSVDISIES